MKVNTNAEALEALHAPAKRKAIDQHSDVENKCLKGNSLICTKYFQKTNLH